MNQAIALAQKLISCPSVTPEDNGALDVIDGFLSDLGFKCHRLNFKDEKGIPIHNLYAKRGNKGRNFCFAGHTDVVPVGDESLWRVPPFGAVIEDDCLIGRGATDMKGSIACFLEAVESFLTAHADFDETLSLLITGDEEGAADYGTVRVLKWLEEQNETLDVCLIGEPTNPDDVGDMLKIGRRGSLTAWITFYGTGGHVAYPNQIDNPINRATRTLDVLQSRCFNDENQWFPATNLEVTTVDVGNQATNVVPYQCHGALNIRFNSSQTAQGLSEWIKKVCDENAGKHELKIKVSGQAFLLEDFSFAHLIQKAISQVTGKKAKMSTTGGTSDGRFIYKYCPVVEFGLVSKTMHQPNELVKLKDMKMLIEIYEEILTDYFK